jgi:hypothetical protein
MDCDFAMKVMSFGHFDVERSWFAFLDRHPTLRARTTQAGRPALFLDALAFGITATTAGHRFYVCYILI